MKEKIMEFIKGNLKNRLYALAFIGLGAITVWLTGEGNFLVLSLLIGIPLFFSRKDWVID